MTKREFYRMPIKKKTGYVFSKLLIVLAVIGMGVAAIFASGLSLPTVESQLSFSFGVVLIGFVTIFAVTNRLKALFKIKSLTFIILLLILLAFSYTLDFLIYSIGFISIPLLIDDIVISPLWDNYVANTQDTREISVEE